MTSTEIILLMIVFAVCCLALIWLILNFRRGAGDHPTGKSDDRDETVGMLTGVGDRFSLSIYKKVYKIDDQEIAEKRKAYQNKDAH
jgi:hypothetical protein